MAPISDLLRAVVRDDRVSHETLETLVARFDEAAPALRDVLARASRGRPLSDDDAVLFFYGLHVLAAGRDRQSFAALMQFLRRPAAEVDDLLGDGATASLPRLVAGLFDGDTESLLVAATDIRLDDRLRDALIAAAAFLTWDGRIGRERMHAFLAAFEETPPPDGDMAWYAWAHAVALLGLRDLLPRVESIFKAGRFPEEVIEWREIEQDLRDAERAPSDIERFIAAGLGYADDIVATLRWTELGDLGSDEGDAPFVNPFRDVGRNDPCPCGSGKKFKKCCLIEA